MMLKKEGIVISVAKRERNLLLLDLTTSGAAIAIKSRKFRVIMISGCGQPIYLVNKIKHIQICHWQLVYASNAQVVRAFRLIYRINLNNFGNNKLYNLTKILIDLDNLDVSNSKSKAQVARAAPAAPQHFKNSILTIVLYQKGNLDNFDRLCTSCICSKLT